MRFCLNMIVKNESARITRALNSVAQFVTAAVIADTGSTDSTKEIITDWCKQHNIPLALVDVPFHDWSQARNDALAAARAALIPKCDYFLLMDADMEFRITDPIAFSGCIKDGASYDAYQIAGSLHYQNRRFIKTDATGGYLGVTHEYLDVATAGCIPEGVAYFLDHADGANRPEKFKRDIRLLKDGLRAEPNNARYYFYLAQSYRDAGQHQKAAEWYKRRVEAGGWDEEVWNAQVNYAHCMRSIGREADFIRELLVAYNMRPSRAEPLFDLANYYRLRSENALSLVFSEAGLQIPKSKDALFVNDYVYEVGLAEEYSICAFYQESKRKNGFVVTDHLATKPGPYAGSRALARGNLFWYLPKITEFCPSFKSRKIDFTPPSDWTAMNPSVTRHKDMLMCVVRTVNYKIDEWGRYLIRGTDGTANATNPINTRNYLIELTDKLDTAFGDVREIYAPDALTCEFPLVIGFEDMRLISWKGDLWTSSTVRQIHSDGNCEQVLACVNRRMGGTFLSDVKRMLREPRQTQKNWAPISTGDTLRFLYRPGHVVDIHGNDVSVHPTTGLDTGQINGSSQLIPFEDGWLSIHHEANIIPGRQTRHYWHRFMFHDKSFRMTRMSLPFVFEDKQIEFCAGMCWHPNDTDLVISYGVRDSEARIATIPHHEVSRLLWFKQIGKEVPHGN